MDHSAEWDKLNYVLILLGVSFSFSTLQDPRKTQNKFSRMIWRSPGKGKIAIGIISSMAFGFISFGLYLLYYSNTNVAENISVGLTVLGIGQIGLLKTALEMFENHRVDRQKIKDKAPEMLIEENP